MISETEGQRIRAIREKVLKGKFVSNEEKQWILDMLKKEQLPVRADVIRRAANSGFDVSNIKLVNGKI